MTENDVEKYIKAFSELEALLQQHERKYISAPLSVTDYLIILNALEFICMAGKHLGSLPFVIQCGETHKNVLDVLVKADVFSNKEKKC